MRKLFLLMSVIIILASISFAQDVSVPKAGKELVDTALEQDKPAEIQRMIDTIEQSGVTSPSVIATKKYAEARLKANEVASAGFKPSSLLWIGVIVTAVIGGGLAFRKRRKIGRASKKVKGFADELNRIIQRLDHLIKQKKELIEKNRKETWETIDKGYLEYDYNSLYALIASIQDINEQLKTSEIRPVSEKVKPEKQAAKMVLPEQGKLHSPPQKFAQRFQEIIDESNVLKVELDRMHELEPRMQAEVQKIMTTIENVYQAVVMLDSMIKAEDEHLKEEKDACFRAKEGKYAERINSHDKTDRPVPKIRRYFELLGPEVNTMRSSIEGWDQETQDKAWKALYDYCRPNSNPSQESLRMIGNLKSQGFGETIENTKKRMAEEYRKDHDNLQALIKTMQQRAGYISEAFPKQEQAWQSMLENIRAMEKYAIELDKAAEEDLSLTRTVIRQEKDLHRLNSTVKDRKIITISHLDRIAEGMKGSHPLLTPDQVRVMVKGKVLQYRHPIVGQNLDIRFRILDLEVHAENPVYNLEQLKKDGSVAVERVSARFDHVRQDLNIHVERLRKSAEEEISRTQDTKKAHYYRRDLGILNNKDIRKLLGKTGMREHIFEEKVLERYYHAKNFEDFMATVKNRLEEHKVAIEAANSIGNKSQAEYLRQQYEEALKTVQKVLQKNGWSVEQVAGHLKMFMQGKR